MASIPSVLVVLDLSALAVLTAQEWVELSRLGRVYLPQSIYEEVRMAFGRSPDPDIEAISRSFNRFYPTSGWETTDLTASHSDFKPPSGQAIPKRPRLSLAAARCAVAVAQANPTSMVVVVTSDRTLVKKLQDSSIINLSGITPQDALQWSRTGQRSVSVMNKFQQLRGSQGGGMRSTATATHATKTSTKSKSVGGGISTGSVASPSTTKTWKRSPLRPAGVPSEATGQLVSLILTAVGLFIAGWFTWQVIQHFQRNGFPWQAPRQEQRQQP